jgi:hypothetical protein
MPALEAVLDLAVRAGGDAARAAAVLEAAEGILAHARDLMDGALRIPDPSRPPDRGR